MKVNTVAYYLTKKGSNQESNQLIKDGKITQTRLNIKNKNLDRLRELGLEITTEINLLKTIKHHYNRLIEFKRLYSVKRTCKTLVSQ